MDISTLRITTIGIGSPVLASLVYYDALFTKPTVSEANYSSYHFHALWGHFDQTKILTFMKKSNE